MNRKFAAVLFILLVVGIVFVSGCTSSTDYRYRSPPPPSGGGCGISAPISDNIAIDAIPETNPAL